MKHKRPQRTVKTMRKRPVLLPKAERGRLSERSACVTAFVLGILESKTARIHAEQLKKKEERNKKNGVEVFD